MKFLQIALILQLIVKIIAQKPQENSLIFPGHIVNISNKSLTDFDLKQMSVVNRLIDFNCSHNLVEEIQSHHFKDAISLKTIDLSFNKISKISNDAFLDQRRLMKLNLNSNGLKKLEIGSFESLVNLREIFLQTNQLTELENGLIDKNMNLAIAHFQENKIKEIGDGIFRNCKKLIDIKLYKNHCTEKDEKFQIVQTIYSALTKQPLQKHRCVIRTPDKDDKKCESDEHEVKSESKYLLIVTVLSVALGVSLITVAILSIFLHKSRSDLKVLKNTLNNPYYERKNKPNLYLEK